METDPTHFIDRHILRVLTFQQVARYRDLRPANTDSNLFNYHRKVLMKQGYIVKDAHNFYTLGIKGLQLAERATFSDLRVRNRPKLSVTLLLTNDKGEIAVWDKPVQPFIHTFNLPTGKMRFSDASVMDAAKRIFLENATVVPKNMKFVGTAEVAISQKGELLVHAIHMVLRAVIRKHVMTNDEITWLDLKGLKQLKTTPGVTEICADFLQANDLLYKNYTFDL